MKVLLLLAGALLLAACQRGADDGGVMRTRAPGHVAAGGGTSGQAIAAASAAGSSTASGAATAPAPAGTPGIPKGAEGNTGGTSPGGNLSEQGTHNQSPPMKVRSEKSGTAPASRDVKTGDQKSPGALQPSAPDKAGR